MITVSKSHSALHITSAPPQPVFDSAFTKRWKKQMISPWRFYYFDLDRINNAMTHHQQQAVIAEEYLKVIFNFKRSFNVVCLTPSSLSKNHIYTTKKKISKIRFLNLSRSNSENYKGEFNMPRRAYLSRPLWPIS
jgi:hypothetical protein